MFTDKEWFKVELKTVLTRMFVYKQNMRFNEMRAKVSAILELFTNNKISSTQSVQVNTRS
jgi:hypothetical protein